MSTVAAPHRPWSTIVFALAGLAAARAARADASPLDLAALLEEAERANPAIQAAQARARAASHVPSQVEALPDPTVAVSYTNDGLTDLTLGSSPDSNLTVSWSQEVPFPGKRLLAGRVARSEVDVADRSTELVRSRVRAEIKGTYGELLRIERVGAILEESRKLLESFRDTTKVRLETGAGVLENVLRAQADLGRIDVEVEALAQERTSAQARLLALLGRMDEEELGPALAAPELAATDERSLVEVALARSPDLLRLRAIEVTEEARVELANRNRHPDLMWTASYANRGGLDPMVTGMFGLRLPLWRRGKQDQAILQAQSEREAARRDSQFAEADIASRVRDLVARAERSERQIRLFDEGISIQARSALDAATTAYLGGRVEFLTVIDDFRVLLEARREREIRFEERIRSLAALEPLTGRTLVAPRAGAAAMPRNHDALAGD